MVKLSGGYKHKNGRVRLSNGEIVGLDSEGRFNCPKEDIDRFKEAGFVEIVEEKVVKEKVVDKVVEKVVEEKVVDKDFLDTLEDEEVVEEKKEEKTFSSRKFKKGK